MSNIPAAMNLPCMSYNLAWGALVFTLILKCGHFSHRVRLIWTRSYAILRLCLIDHLLYLFPRHPKWNMMETLEQDAEMTVDQRVKNIHFNYCHWNSRWSIDVGLCFRSQPLCLLFMTGSLFMNRMKVETLASRCETLKPSNFTAVEDLRILPDVRQVWAWVASHVDFGMLKVKRGGKFLMFVESRFFLKRPHEHPAELPSRLGSTLI